MIEVRRIAYRYKSGAGKTLTRVPNYFYLNSKLVFSTGILEYSKYSANATSRYNVWVTYIDGLYFTNRSNLSLTKEIPFYFSNQLYSSGNWLKLAPNASSSKLSSTMPGDFRIGGQGHNDYKDVYMFGENSLNLKTQILNKNGGTIYFNSLGYI